MTHLDAGHRAMFHSRNTLGGEDLSIGGRHVLCYH
jgi:hypothetical protein